MPCATRRPTGQPTLISMRIVDNSDVNDDDLDAILDMTVRALGAPLS